MKDIVWTVLFVGGVFFAGYALGTMQELRTWQLWNAAHPTVYDLTAQP